LTRPIVASPSIGECASAAKNTATRPGVISIHSAGGSAKNPPVPSSPSTPFCRALLPIHLTATAFVDRHEVEFINSLMPNAKNGDRHEIGMSVPVSAKVVSRCFVKLTEMTRLRAGGGI